MDVDVNVDVDAEEGTAADGSAAEEGKGRGAARAGGDADEDAEDDAAREEEDDEDDEELLDEDAPIEEALDHEEELDFETEQAMDYLGYRPGVLDDPDMVQGRHRHVLVGDGRRTGPVISSILLFVNPKTLKEELNTEFRDRFPLLPPSLTLSKLRSLKRSSARMAYWSGLELSTLALACVYFERLCFQRCVTKFNRRVTFACCVLIAYKFNESVDCAAAQDAEAPRASDAHSDMHYDAQDAAGAADPVAAAGAREPPASDRAALAALWHFVDQRWGVSREQVLAAEFGVFARLSFSLHAPLEHVLYHFNQLLRQLETDARRYLGAPTWSHLQRTLRRLRAMPRPARPIGRVLEEGDELAPQEAEQQEMRDALQQSEQKSRGARLRFFNFGLGTSARQIGEDEDDTEASSGAEPADMADASGAFGGNKANRWMLRLWRASPVPSNGEAESVDGDAASRASDEDLAARPASAPLTAPRGEGAAANPAERSRTPPPTDAAVHRPTPKRAPQVGLPLFFDR